MKKFALLLATLLTFQSYAKDIHCTTARGSQAFLINGNTVTFEVNFGQEKRRVPASAAQARTKRTGSGFDQYLSFERNKYRIHIENTEEFSALNDYVIIKSPKGHEMTYPLNCK